MKVKKTPKKAIKLTEIKSDDWLFLRSITSNLVNEANCLQDVMVAGILSEIFFEKNSTPYLNLLPETLKLKSYQVLAISHLLMRREYSYYSSIGRQLLDLFLSSVPNKLN